MLMSMLGELHKRVNQIVPINGLSVMDNGSITVSYVDIPSPEQEVAVSAVLATAPLENAKLCKLAEIEKEWKDTMKAGWTTPYGWTVGMDTQDITLLTGLFMLAKEAASLGITDPVNVIDTAGQPHSLTLAELTGLMLQYGNHRAGLSNTYAERRNLVNIATSIEDLEEI